MKVLSKEYIYEHGKDISEIRYDSVREIHVVLDTDVPYNGIGYSKYENNEMKSYCYYKDGLGDGESVEFYPIGKVKAWNNFRMGTGECKEWYENEMLMSMGKFKDKICLEYRIWDEKGGLVELKKSPTEEDINRMKKRIGQV